MKKIFTLITMMVLAIAANAEVKTLYSWESPEGTVSEQGGTIAYVNGDGDRLNYTNASYYTICLNGKKANINDAPSANAGHMVITFDEPLKKGDEIAFTCYYNKGEQKNVSAWLVYENGKTASTARVSADIATGAEPEVIKVTVTEDGDGSNTLTMTRNDAGTNMFITKLVITGEREAAPQPQIFEYTVDADIYVHDWEANKKYNKELTGQKVKVVFNFTDAEATEGTIDVTLPAAVLGPCKMEEQTIKGITIVNEEGMYILDFGNLNSKEIITVTKGGEPVALTLDNAEGVIEAGHLGLLINVTEPTGLCDITVRYFAQGIKIPTANEVVEQSEAPAKTIKVAKDGKLLIGNYNVAGQLVK